MEGRSVSIRQLNCEIDAADSARRYYDKVAASTKTVKGFVSYSRLSQFLNAVSANTGTQFGTPQLNEAFFSAGALKVEAEFMMSPWGYNISITVPSDWIAPNSMSEMLSLPA